MVRKVFALATIILMFVSSTVCGEQVHCNWIGPDGGCWEDPCNWSCGLIPDNNGSQTFAVTISTTQRTRVCLQESHTIDQLTCDGDVDIENDLVENFYDCPTLTFVDDLNGLTNLGKLDLSGEGWEHNIKGNVRNTNDAHMQFEGELDVEGTFDNEGTVLVIPGSELSVDAGTLTNVGRLTIVNGMVNAEPLENTDTGLIEGTGMIHSNVELHNSGTVSAVGGGLNIYSEGTIDNIGIFRNHSGSNLLINLPTGDFNNHGSIEVKSDGSFTSPCNLVNKPNATIRLLGGTLEAPMITQSADANFSGFGSISGDLILEADAIVKLTGPTNIVGDVNIPADATLEISDGQTLITGFTVCDGTIHLIGGTVIFQGGCDREDCNIIHEPGPDRNHFDINADGIEDFKDFASFANTWLWQASWY